MHHPIGHGRVRRHALLLAAALPPSALGVFVALYGITVPYWDQWELVPALDKLYAGSLTWHDWVAQHNAHRIVFPRLIMLGIASLTGWNIAWELAVNALLGAGIFAVLAAYGADFARQTRAFTAHLAVCAASIAAFSLAQWRNWLWGWQIQIFLCVLCALAAFFLLAAASDRRAPFAGAVLLAIISTFSFGAGLAVWPAGFIAIVVRGGTNRTAFAVIWCVVSAMSLTAYMVGFELPGDALPPDRSAGGLVQALLYVLAFVGGAVANPWPVVSLCAGVVGLAAFAAAAYQLWRRDGFDRLLAAPAMAVATFVVLSAAIAASGRGGEGIMQATESRYTTFSAPFWFVTALVMCAAAGQPHLRSRWVWRAGAMLVIAALVVNSAMGAWAGRQRGIYYNAARDALIAGRDDATMGRLYPDIDMLREHRAVIERLGLSVFGGRPAGK